MNTGYIPQSILQNPNIDLNDPMIGSLNDLFYNYQPEENHINNKYYKQLIVDVNDRIDAEMKAKKAHQLSILKEIELRQAKEELKRIIKEKEK